jgi:hypothetical protein
MESSDRGLVRQEILEAMATTRGNQCFGGQDTRLDRGPDPFAALWIREARGITDQQQAVRDD